MGTGFSTGKITARSQEESAADFIKFFKNFQDLFGIKRFRVFITGESYAGRYVPYISSAMLDQNDTTYYDVQGALVYDPCIGQFDYVQEEVPAVPFVQANANLFNFNDTFMAELESLYQSCGYANYTETYLKFPPPGNQPIVPADQPSESCDVFDLIFSEALNNNPCFNIYSINEQCPLLWDVLAFVTTLTYTPAGANVYFDRPDVKAAIHAPPNVTWSECGENNVFVGKRGSGPEGEGDLSADPIQHVLPQVIERTNRVLVGNGDLDLIIVSNGTLMSIQNMTWNGMLGFQEEPSTPINIEIPDLAWMTVYDSPVNEENGADGPQGYMGTQHYERGLMWTQVK